MTLSTQTAEAVAARADIRPEQPQDGARVDAIIEHAFGPGRLAKSVERLREAAGQPLLDISLVAWDGEEAVGCVRMWPIRIGDAPAVLLGPIAVEDEWRRHGLGSDLVLEACEAAARAGHGLVLLVGDQPFFGKLGFEPVPAKAIVLPGPVNARRVLWRPLRPGALDGVGGVVSAG